MLDRDAEQAHLALVADLLSGPAEGPAPVSSVSGAGPAAYLKCRVHATSPVFGDWPWLHIRTPRNAFGVVIAVGRFLVVDTGAPEHSPYDAGPASPEGARSLADRITRTIIPRTSA